MGTFFKKDILVFWRDRKEVLIALFLPIVLIFILNAAFSNLFNSDKDSINLEVGIVIEDDSSIGLEQLEQTINESSLEEEEKEALIQHAEQIRPVDMVRSFLTSPELNQMMRIQELSHSKAIKKVEDGELDAIIHVPNGFTHEILHNLLLGEQSDVPLMIQAIDQSSELRTLQRMINSFIHNINLQFALGTITESPGQEVALPEGGIEIIEGAETYSIAQYITIAMCTLFSLFMAQTVAMKTITEKRELVFHRIILSDSRPFQYLMGRMLAAFFLTWLQIMITLFTSQLLFDIFPDKSNTFWTGIIVSLTIYSFVIAGFATLFTSITLNMKDPDATNGLISIIIMGMAILGGNFTPIQMLPEFLQIIGEWTPNGLTMKTILEWIQFNQAQELIFPNLVLFGVFIACLTIGMIIFPRRGRN